MVTRRQLSLLILSCVLFAPANARADELFVVETSQVVLRIQHLPLGRFDTTAENGVEASFAVKDGSVTLPDPPLIFHVDRLRSWVPLRDQHMKTHLGADAYPVMEVNDFKADTRSGDFSAALKVRETTRPIRGRFSVEGTRAKAEFKAKMSDFGIKPPEYRGVGVKDDFEVLIDLALERVEQSEPEATPKPTKK